MPTEHGIIVSGSGIGGKDGIHVVQEFTWANLAAREAEVIAADDVGKIGFQTDDERFFIANKTGSGNPSPFQRLAFNEANILTVNQVAHGFGVGTIVFQDGTGAWTIAQADDAATLGVARVWLLHDANNFTLVISGIVSPLIPGVAAGVLGYLSDTIAGTITATRPTAAGSFQNPIGFAVDAQVFLMLGWKHEIVPEMANRQVLLSPTDASLASTDHALQLGEDAQFRTKFSPGVMQIVNAGGAEGNYRMQGGQLRFIATVRVKVESDVNAPFELLDPTTVALSADATQQIRTTSDAGAVLRALIGLSGTSGLLLQNLQTGVTGNANITMVTSGNGGMVVPVVANTAAISSPVDGMIIYSTADNAFRFRENGAWVAK